MIESVGKVLKLVEHHHVTSPPTISASYGGHRYAAGSASHRIGARLSDATRVNSIVADPKMKARLADLGGSPLAGSPADFGRLIAEETDKWAKVVKFANIKPDGANVG